MKIILGNYLTVTFFLFFCAMVHSDDHQLSSRPNFILILVDDLGWRDLSCYGSSFHETPNIDALAANSMRFNWAYSASPMCSPTRASILTGKHPARHGITQYISGWRSSRFRTVTPLTGLSMDREDVTLGEALKEAGYNTAFMGKWHVGNLKKYGSPRDHGYDIETAIIESNRCAMYHPFGGVDYFPGSKKGDYFTDLLTNAAISFIMDQRNTQEPFYLHLCHFAMHSPIKSKPEQRDYFAEKAHVLPAHENGETGIEDAYSHERIKERQDDPEYAGELANLDFNIGRLLEALDISGQAEDTVVLFASDNGGRSSMWRFAHPTSNSPLRAGKTFTFEGGIRTPLLIRWPGITAGGQSCDTPVISMDFYPTMLEMAGLSLRPEEHKDGVSLVPLLKGESIDRKTLFWHFPHYQGEGAYPSSAVREGNYKLIRHFHFERDQLFNLARDPYEKNDLATKEPKRAAAMGARLEAWFEEVGAKIPVKNQSQDIIEDIDEKHRDRIRLPR